MRPISAVIIAKDERERLEACVASCRPFADEVVVVDGGSRDGTPELARSLGCVVHENEWPGFGRQRNFGAERASHDWIFWIDADEVAGEDLGSALRRWKDDEVDDCVVLAVERVGDFMGRWLFGASEWLPRLYDRRACQISDVAVHETVVGGGEPDRLRGRLWHYGFRSFSDHVARFDRYTTLEAEKAWEAGRRFSIWRLLWRPPARLLKVLLGRRMYREGVAGLGVCALWVDYEVMRELKLRELEWRRGGEGHDAPR